MSEPATCGPVLRSSAQRPLSSQSREHHRRGGRLAPLLIGAWLASHGAASLADAPEGSSAAAPAQAASGTSVASAAAAAAAASAGDASAASAGSAAANPTRELKQMSLQQLMNIRVTSVSRQSQPLLQAAAAIQVITSDEIRRSGATNLPEALRLADNLEVAQVNAHDWAISARGFNANLANKLLVLIDGRPVYTPLYGGVLWNVQDYPLSDIDRIEVISGPGGTLWGANAVNGVINIITKSAQQTQGLHASVAAGNQLADQEELRYGAEPATNLYVRAYGEYTGRGDEVVTDGASAHDAWQVGRGGFRLDDAASLRDQLTLQGDAYHGDEDAGGLGEADLAGGNLLGRWSHTSSSGSTLSLQVYYDHTYLVQPFAASPAAPPYYTGFPGAALTDNLDTDDAQFQYHFLAGSRQQFIWGLEYRATQEVDQDASVVRFQPPALDQSLYSGFLQDQVLLTPDMSMTVGSKLEHNSYTGFEVEPNVRWQWNPDAAQLLWAAVSRAVRTPSRYDHDLEVVSGLTNAPSPYEFPSAYLTGSRDFISETLIAYELGYRADLGSHWSGSLSTFYNDYDHLRSTSATPTTAYYIFPYPIYFQNNLQGETHGLELSSSYQPLDWWRLHAGYDLLLEHLYVRPGAVDTTDALNETADPRGQASLRSSMDLPRGTTLDTALRWVDALHIDNGPTSGPLMGIVPAYWEMDARLAWQVTRRLSVSLVGQNLLREYHVEYGYPSPAREQIARSVFARVTWGH
ncbi:MAG TPA: TonB-dependent receptor plug domain-containing protein [Steroidobacteraceae bacterium]|nr:TonB-dependent receptor plug domain-containing protein [Steroidobacteraceae bacterium]